MSRETESDSTRGSRLVNHQHIFRELQRVIVISLFLYLTHYSVVIYLPVWPQHNEYWDNCHNLFPELLFFFAVRPKLIKPIFQSAFAERWPTGHYCHHQWWSIISLINQPTISTYFLVPISSISHPNYNTDGAITSLVPLCHHYKKHLHHPSPGSSNTLSRGVIWSASQLSRQC